MGRRAIEMLSCFSCSLLTMMTVMVMMVVMKAAVRISLRIEWEVDDITEMPQRKVVRVSAGPRLPGFKSWACYFLPCDLGQVT